MRAASPIDAAELERLLALGERVRDIARRFRTDERRITERMADLGLMRPEERRRAEGHALDARVAELAREGLTGAKIAEIMGLTRNQVIGRAFRMGVTLGFGRKRVLHVKLPPKAEKASRPKVERKAAPRAVPKPSPAVLVVPKVDLAPVVPGPAGGVPFLELAPRGCKFAVGQDAQGSHLFCGGSRAEGLPYCRHHAQIAYRPVEPKIRKRAA
ncbi:GcrA cell cycle regulator [Rhodoligotrophos appendicifer]|uniref:GcrA family cell cycle regulator n=1 Tax=Rhodoligotrophos appendicifer TaxID=987056 RepID=UPI001186189F|nr:GcrA family cell cycle regulator [Rhodoligotrophos appendicifer]